MWFEINTIVRWIVCRSVGFKVTQLPPPPPTATNIALRSWEILSSVYGQFYGIMDRVLELCLWFLSVVVINSGEYILNPKRERKGGGGGWGVEGWGWGWGGLKQHELFTVVTSVNWNSFRPTIKVFGHIFIPSLCIWGNLLNWWIVRYENGRGTRTEGLGWSGVVRRISWHA